jgi:hypothetical protein
LAGVDRWKEVLYINCDKIFCSEVELRIIHYRLAAHAPEKVLGKNEVLEKAFLDSPLYCLQGTHWVIDQAFFVTFDVAGERTFLLLQRKRFVISNCILSQVFELCPGATDVA